MYIAIRPSDAINTLPTVSTLILYRVNPSFSRMRLGYP